ncbi:MAG: hypothetical protein J6J33_02695 [Clostridia bacterium]|nr:hypothetical protein [Clostridia bacterium]
MKIIKTLVDKTCECGNKACYEISHKYGIINFKIYVCKACIAEIYKKIGLNLIPTSPTNILNKSNKTRKEL